MTLDSYNIFNDEYLFNMPLSPLPKVVRNGPMPQHFGLGFSAFLARMRMRMRMRLRMWVWMI